MIKSLNSTCIPETRSNRHPIRSIGKGYQGADSYGIKDFTAEGGASNDWHESLLPGLVAQGKEHAMDEMPEWKPEFITTVSEGIKYSVHKYTLVVLTRYSILVSGPG